MKKYVAVFGARNGRIISVGAENEAEAKTEIKRQLSKPGRRDALKRWIEDGRKVITDN